MDVCQLVNSQTQAKRWMHVCLIAWPQALDDATNRGWTSPSDASGHSSGRYGDPTAFCAVKGSDLSAYAQNWVGLLDDCFFALCLTNDNWQKMVWTAKSYWFAFNKPRIDNLMPKYGETIKKSLAKTTDIAINAKFAHNDGIDGFCDALFALSNGARVHWPQMPKKGSNVGGVTIGERTNTVQTCGLCDLPVVGGKNDPIRTIDNIPFHAKSCWFTASRAKKSKISEKAA